MKQSSYLVGLVFLGTCLLLRPTVFGGTYTALGTVLFFIFFFIYIVATMKWNYSLGEEIPSTNHFAHVPVARQALLFALFWIYGISLTMVVQDVNLEFLFKAALTVIPLVLAFAWVSRDHAVYVGFFDGFAKLNAFTGWSILITSGLLKIVPYGALQILSIPIKNYEEIDLAGDVLLPFTIVYGYLSEYDVYKYAGLAREAGIAQVFFAWSIAYLCLAKAAPLWRLGALIGLLFCGSSAAMINLALVIVIIYALNPSQTSNVRIISTAVVFCVALAAFLVPGFGLLDKQETHLTSIEDRTTAMAFAWSQEGMSFLFGNGLYSLRAPVEQLGINAISGVYSYGLIGFLLQLVAIFSPLACSGVNRRGYLACALPVAITAFVFQPLLDSPLIYLMYMYIPMTPATHAPVLASANTPTKIASTTA